MPIFKKPTFSKKNPNTGEVQNCYFFEIDTDAKEEGIECMVESVADLTLDTLKEQVEENRTWWMDLIQQFLQAHTAMFSKAYTAGSLYKVMKHVIMPKIHSTSYTFPGMVRFFPVMFEVLGGSFFVKWSYRVSPVTIDIPDPETPPPMSMGTLDLPVLRSDELEEVDVNDIPMDKASTDTSIDSTASIRQADRHRVKEARLKARISLYRAQLQLRQYYEKYGEEYEDSEYDTDDASSEEDVDEIQL